jgi:uncharacterized membrane protein
MQEGLTTAMWWLAFGGTHVGLSVRPIRRRLVSILGEAGYVLFYSAVAVATFSGLVHYVALHRFDAPHAPLLATVPPVHGAMLAIAAFGFTLFVTAVVGYPGFPMAVFRHRTMPARGVQQLTRHPFFSGISLWAAAHAVLAPSQVSFVFFVGVIVLAVFGGLHQDRRLIEELGEPYRAYVAETSFWPFVAIATKRQKVRWSEQPWFLYSLGVGASAALYQFHAHIFDHGGIYIIGAVTLGSVAAMLSSRARARREPGN